jgi:hypothetical protein
MTLLLFHLQQLSLPVEPDPRSPAELALDHEYAKEYSRRCMAEHTQRQKAENGFLRSRWLALNAMPSSLRKQALVEDFAPWPKHYMPIPWSAREYVKRFGYSGEKAIAAAQAAAEADGEPQQKTQQHMAVSKK